MSTIQVKLDLDDFISLVRRLDESEKSLKDMELSWQAERNHHLWSYGSGCSMCEERDARVKAKS